MDETVDGGPSLLFDAIALLSTVEGAAALAMNATAKDFVNDARAHAKFVARTPSAEELLAAVGLSDDKRDGG